jgi:hypothetical protein
MRVVQYFVGIYAFSTFPSLDMTYGVGLWILKTYCHKNPSDWRTRGQLNEIFPWENLRVSPLGATRTYIGSNFRSKEVSE